MAKQPGAARRTGPMPKSKRPSPRTTTLQAKQPAAVAVSNAPELLKKSRSQWPESEEAFRPRPSHYRYLRAYSELLEEGGRVNMASIARRMGISPQAFWALRQRCAGLDRWVSEQLGRKNELYAEPIIRKLAAVALQGSVDHAKLYFQVSGRLAPTAGDGGGVVGTTVSMSGPTIINLAVPRPGDPPICASRELLPHG